MNARRRGRPISVNRETVKNRAYDLYILLRSLPEELKEQFLNASPAEITKLFPPSSSGVAGKFPNGEFPAQLAFEARNHADYPKRDIEGQVRFTARYIAGADNAKPEYALKITRNFLPDKFPTRIQQLPNSPGQKSNGESTN